jgi:hypothetical protein
VQELQYQESLRKLAAASEALSTAELFVSHSSKSKLSESTWSDVNVHDDIPALVQIFGAGSLLSDVSSLSNSTPYEAGLFGQNIQILR